VDLFCFVDLAAGVLEVVNSHSVAQSWSQSEPVEDGAGILKSDLNSEKIEAKANKTLKPVGAKFNH
jgi:hypothetical protein